MIADLDPGFTVHGFRVNALLVLLGSFAGAAGAFGASWYIYRKTSQDEKSRFQEGLRPSREQLHETIQPDVQMRRDEEKRRTEERKDTETMQQLRLWYTLRGEIDVNLRAITSIRLNQPA